MELRHLRYFMAVAEALSFSRAADRLHLTRPALSKQIKELEDEVGARLIDRNTARVSLTAAGMVYHHEVREILARTKQAGVLAREAADGKRGVLSIGEAGVLGLAFLTSALARYRERFPDVEVMVKEIPTKDQGGAIIAGDIRVGFMLGEHLAKVPRLDSCTVIDFRMGVGVSPTHPLAGRKRVNAEDLADQSLICVGHAHRSEHAVYTRDLLASNGPALKALRGVSGLGALMTMIASGHGVSFLPHVMGGNGPGGITVVPFDGPGKQLDFQFKAAWRRDDDSPMVKNFVRTLRRFSKQAAA